MANVPLSDRDALLSEGGLEVDMLRNITLIHHVGNTAMRRHLEAVGIERFTSCIVFADEEEEGDIMQSDSKSLATLLLIRDIQSHNKDMIDRGFVKQRANQDADGKIPIVTEILIRGRNRRSSKTRRCVPSRTFSSPTTWCPRFSRWCARIARSSPSWTRCSPLAARPWRAFPRALRAAR